MALSDYALWRSPSHHEDLDEAHDHVHWVELFYDLIHVVCIFMLGNYLSHHLSFQGLFIFAALFTAIWMAWAEASYFSSLFVSTDVYHRCIMLAQVCTVMLMAASIPDIADGGAVYFGVAYACNRALTALLYRRVIWRRAGAFEVSREMSRNFFIAALVFLVAAFLPSPWSYCLFGVMIVLIQISFFHPKYGVMRLKRFTPRVAHFSERFALLFLIVMGEGFFKLVIALSEKGVDKVSADVLINFFLGGITIFILTWAYFDFVGNGSPIADNKKLRARWWYGHLALMLAGVMIGVALKAEVQVDFFDQYPFKYAVLACGGFILFCLSLATIQSAIEHHAGHRFYTRDVQVFGIAMAIVTLCAVPFVPAWVGNALFGIAVVSQIAIPLVRAVRAIETGDKT
ncbi:low temperature requirement protein A [Leucothrix mucor]|uniref:low temperature requirement protein A n=1 Tax=Leucothrix mucor TaxID=45248 RepID=UPI0003B72F82|nr:low temperature requirement protein A [Leucothrix mucor]